LKTRYPETFERIPEWARENQIKITEARARFAQYAILNAVAGSRSLSQILVFKGGNALDFVWQPNRSTKDLDFTSLDAGLGEERIRTLLGQSLGVVGRRLGVDFHINGVTRNPPGPDKTFVTYEVRVGYALPDDRNNKKRIANGGPSMTIVPVEISLNEPVCADTPIDVQAIYPLRVSTPEDIVAEKLRSLLQQPVRKRNRRQDLLDIAVLLRSDAPLQRPLISRYLLEKASARNISASRTAFHDPEVRSRAHSDYAALQDDTRELFVPFEEAWGELSRLVDSLDIPA
jgi:predicted nucleotidyltransferase component of viral defense system